MAVLIIAEHNNSKITKATLSTINAAKQLSHKKIDILIMGHSCLGAAIDASKIKGISKNSLI